MFGSRREKILGLGLAAVIALVAVDRLLSTFVLDPIATADERLRGLRRAVAQKESEFATIEAAERRVRDVRSNGFGPDASRAAVLYQNWLLKTVRELDLDGALVTPGSVIAEGEVGWRLPFRIEVTSSRKSLGTLLDVLHSESPLQRVTGVTLDSSREQPGAMRAVIEVETLGLQTAEPISMAELVATPKSERGTILRDTLSARQPFEGPLVERPRTPYISRTPSPRPTVNPLSRIRLIACVIKDSHFEAWLLDESDSSCVVYSEGDRLPYAGSEGTVRRVTLRGIDVDLPDGVVTISVGETLSGLINRGPKRSGFSGQTT